MKNWPSVEELMRMAETDPEGLEKFRQREIESLIEDAPEKYQRRLRGLQFQVDCQRELASNPISSCIAISKMMRDSLLELNKALNGLDGFQGATTLKADTPVAENERREKPAKPLETGRVIPFPANF